jgi:hypothetical protein
MRSSAVAGALTFSAVLTVVGGGIGGVTARAETLPVEIADLIPLPRPNPIRQSGDPIGTVVNKEPSEASEVPAADAESAPQTASAIAPPPPPPAGVASLRSGLAEAAFKVAVRLFDQGDPNAALVAG